MQRLIAEEAPAFLVVCSVLYRALTIAAGTAHITQWYPRIVSKVKSEVQEGLHGFIRWLNSNSFAVSESRGPLRVCPRLLALPACNCHTVTAWMCF